VLIFDLHNLAWRAFHTTGALKHGSDSTGVIFGVLREIQGHVRRFKDPLVIIASDSWGSLRKEIFPGYKKRDDSKDTEKEKEAKRDCYRQIDALKYEVFPTIGLNNVFEYEGFEADDIMVEIAIRKSKWVKPCIITGDEDIYQALMHADIWSPNKRKKVTQQRFLEEYGIPPHMWSEVKAMAGCSSDTVPGVPGVGEKTAIQYLLGKLKPDSKKVQAIHEAEKSGHLALMRQLVTLPYPFTPESKIVPNRFNRDGMIEICDKYGLSTLKEDINDWDEIFQKRRGQ